MSGKKEPSGQGDRAEKARVKEAIATEESAKKAIAEEPIKKNSIGPLLKNPIFRMTMTLFLVTALTALLLACVNSVTEPEIDRLRQEAVNQAIEDVLSGWDETAELTWDETEKTALPKTVEHVYELKKEGAILGYAVEAAPLGFGGAVRLMVGITPDGKVSGVSIGEMSETPGLGTKVSDETFLNQFVGQSDGWTLSRNADDGPVVAISGATISSTAVAEGVLDSVRTVLPLLGDKSEGGSAS